MGAFSGSAGIGWPVSSALRTKTAPPTRTNRAAAAAPPIARLPKRGRRPRRQWYVSPQAASGRSDATRKNALPFVPIVIARARTAVNAAVLSPLAAQRAELE